MINVIRILTQNNSDLLQATSIWPCLWIKVVSRGKRVPDTLWLIHSPAEPLVEVSSLMNLMRADWDSDISKIQQVLHMGHQKNIQIPFQCHTSIPSHHTLCTFDFSTFYSLRRGVYVNWGSAPSSVVSFWDTPATVAFTGWNHPESADEPSTLGQSWAIKVSAKGEFVVHFHHIALLYAQRWTNLINIK